MMNLPNNSTDSPIRRLGIIGDVHAEHHRLAAALRVLRHRGVDAIVCTGDIVDGVGCPNQSVALLEKSGVQVVRGNHDRWILESKARHIPNAHQLADLSPATRDYLESLPVQLEIQTPGGPLLLCHGIANNDLKKVWPGTARMATEKCTTLDAIIETGDFSLMINGHMHFRTMMHFETLTLINAGTLKGTNWPGFSLIDFDVQRISAFEFLPSGVEHTRSLPLGPPENRVVWRNTQCFTGNWEPVRLFDTRT
ncbi:MAG: metallophosphoesterase family protein [Pseudomonadota bacterium]